MRDEAPVSSPVRSNTLTPPDNPPHQGIDLGRDICLGGGLNWFWNVPDKEPLEGRIKRLEDDFRTLKETRSLDLKNVENDIQSDRSRIKRLETSHSGLKEDKRALHKRVTTLKETLEHKVKVEVGEGILRQRRQPGKEWSMDEIGGGEGSVNCSIIIGMENQMSSSGLAIITSTSSSL
ncbi:hypothetical protein N7516_004929 [Penicillium verrucosum]|uniref:uncharacterized protein n=1 Tax=Penicillium verrucosum TaxID=60171 RepID=UPI002545111C|nr:uncharacterized protein N7516_004929 [Penicillium verrucosum]KAJ5944761.1 hypothetical protein N7516_004929 [Penicillium verrucosum]